MRLSLIVPAYNEAAKLQRDLAAITDYLNEQNYHSEVLFVDDGSIDNTRGVINAFIRRHSFDKVTVRCLHYGANRGKGYAIRHGVSQAKGEVIAFMDVGLCVPLTFLKTGMKKLKEGFAFAIASRRTSESRIVQSQPFVRRAGSKVFWFTMQTFMGVRVSDTQCGFKLYDAKAAQAIFSKVRTDGFMFDIEALLVAKKLGLKGVEFGVEWSNDSDSRYHPVWGTLRNLRELVLIKARVG